VVKDNHNKFQRFRAEFDFFAYESFSINETPDGLRIVFNFNLDDKYSFHPDIVFVRSKINWNKLPPSGLENFAFHLGLIELLSYWKAACPSRILIKPFRLGEEQIDWWKNVWFQGLGEFFYLNNIKTSKDDFADVVCTSKSHAALHELALDEKKVIVPIGGGKDSAVTLELLKDHYQCIPMIMNPRNASISTASVAGFRREEIFELHRSIHPQLLRLNDEGFLNGHTPFSALLAFVSVVCAGLTGTKNIALSNESSANEPTDPETGVNHQYSKSYEFERDFRNYTAKYTSADINYFSFLRPLNEVGIANIFSGFSKYHSIFRSCNAGSKTDSWCGKCPKCLFTYILLSPVLAKDELTRIFNKNLLDDPKLLDIFEELTGLKDIKPFECVGTVDEVNYSLCRTVKKYPEPLPFLLKYYISSPLFQKYRNLSFDLQKLNPDHYLDDRMLAILNQANHG
jgi:hypothetical protein